ncbi:MAG TPA: discoidin domain-containing protein [Tissierellaceae bacterium]|nr:discoidin domain-containing protein [Tissierellaceae bacterium]
MSKGLGQKITIKFTEDLTSVIDTSLQTRVELQNPNYTAVGTYSSNIIDRAFDGNTGTYWESRTVGNYIQIDLAQAARFVHGFKVYAGASYRPSNYTLSTSEDGTTYTTVKTDTIPQATGWHELLLDAPVKARFVRVNFGYSSRLYLYEFILLVGSKIAGFTVKGQQYKYINGPLLDKEYVIENVSAHPTIDKAVLIEFNTFGRFPTAEGNLTVEYDATVGNLAGRGGFVESFTETFTPLELAPEHNPGIIETLTVAPAELEVNFIPITYHKRYTEDTLTVAPAELEVNLIYVGVVNP